MQAAKVIVAGLFAVLPSLSPAAATLSVMAQQALQGVQVEDEVVGEAADKMRAVTRTDGPVMAKVSVLNLMPGTPGCARLRIVMSQGGILTRQGSVVHYEQPIRMNLCPGGSPPPVQGLGYEAEKPVFR